MDRPDHAKTLARLSSLDELARAEAAFAAGRIGNRCPGAIVGRLLWLASHDEEATVRGAATRALGALFRSGIGYVVEDLTRAAKDDYPFGARAAYALEWIEARR